MPSEQPKCPYCGSVCLDVHLDIHCSAICERSLFPISLTSTQARDALGVGPEWIGSPLHRALHVVWTKAVGTPDYVKAEWRLLDDLIAKMLYQQTALAPVGARGKTAARKQFAEPAWWCCKADYPDHEVTCSNYVPTPAAAPVGEDGEGWLVKHFAEHPHVSLVDGIFGGVTPVVSGIRIAVHDILTYLHNGRSIAEIAEIYGLTEDAIKDAIAFAQDVYDEVVEARPAPRPVADDVDDDSHPPFAADPTYDSWRETMERESGGGK